MARSSVLLISPCLVEYERPNSKIDINRSSQHFVYDITLVAHKPNTLILLLSAYHSSSPLTKAVNSTKLFSSQLNSSKNLINSINRSHHHPSKTSLETNFSHTTQPHGCCKSKTETNTVLL